MRFKDREERVESEKHQSRYLIVNLNLYWGLIPSPIAVTPFNAL